jgi:hypothetical protein
MKPFNGLKLNLDNLSQLSDARTFSVARVFLGELFGTHRSNEPICIVVAPL